MAINFQTKTTIRAVDKFSGPMGKMQKSVDGFKRGVYGINKAAEGMKATGGKMTRGLTMPIVGGLAMAVNSAKKFEDAMTDVKKALPLGSFILVAINLLKNG